MFLVCLRRYIAAIALFALTSCGGGHGPVPLLFESTLTGAQALPSTATGAFGLGVVTIDIDRRTLIASVVLSGMTATQVVLQSGTPGLTGPALVALTQQPGESVWTASTAVDTVQLAALRTGAYYFSAASAAFPAGEIRGRIIEIFPSSQHVLALQQVSNQSSLVRRQLQQIRDVEDEIWDGPFIGIGFRLGL